MDLFGKDELFEQFEGTNETALGNASDQSDTDGSVSNEEYQELLTKYTKLKESLRHFFSPANIKVKDPSRDGPIAHVILFNHAISRNYHGEIKEFFENLCLRQLEHNSDDNPSEIQSTFIQYPQTEKEGISKKSSKRTEAKTKAFQAFTSVHLYDNFYLDQIGEPISHKDFKLSCSSQPQYEQSRFDPLIGDNEIAGPVRKKIQRICFNCGKSDHQIKDCDKKRDHKAINERRQKFQDEVAKISGGTPQNRIDGGRYHRDDESNKHKFAKFQPGVVSSALQEALGIKEDDLPPYIYRMRNIGYPPGHLFNAQIVDSGLSFFEEGELDGGGRQKGYIPVDVSKFISFPGFNTPPLPGQVDKFKKFEAPPMNQEQCIENMIAYYEKCNMIYNNQKAVENTRENLQDNRNLEDADTMEVDMDTEHHSVDNTTGNSSQVSANATVNAEDSDVGIEMNIIDGDVGSLTEDELEVKRELLLKQLQQQDSENQDSDYRDIISKDQDYRKLDEVITITDSGDDAASASSRIVIEDDSTAEMSPVVKDSPDSPTPESPDSPTPDSPDSPTPGVAEEIGQANTNLRTDTIENTETGGLIVEINKSSDTDYRLPQPQPIESSLTVENEPIIQGHSIAEDSQNMADDKGKKLPDRKQFAKGISQFDRYYEETKPQGTFLKLKELLKDSPRRQEK